MKIKTRAFTLVELIIGVSISAIVLLIIFSFIADVMNDFSRSKTKTEFVVHVYDFIGTVNEYKQSFAETRMIDISGGYDMILAYSPGIGGVLFGVVDLDTLRLDPVSQSGTYGQKVMAYREITSDQVDTILLDINNPSDVYSYPFFRDKVFENMYIKDFQLRPYNTGALIETNIDLVLQYFPERVGTPLEDLTSDDIFSLSLTF